MFSEHLLRKINTGRCLVLVGSGPSCEVGYPSWRSLAKSAYNKLIELDVVSDVQSYEKYLQREQYPALFRQIQRDLSDDRNAFVNLIKSFLVPKQKRHGSLYEVLCQWPFACYLTTNFDDEISEHLSNLHEYFTVVRNRPEDFHIWRDGVSHIIQKLHSDLNHPNEVILTSADYQRLETDSSGKYFREGLSRIFTMFSVLIVGHSLSDPDIDNILKLAKNSSDPRYPIYFIAAGFTSAEEKELFEQYNIVLVRYSNSDGRHTGLLQLLRTMNRFVVSREQRKERRAIEERPDEEVEAAIALSLYRRLQAVQPRAYFSPIILSALNKIATGDVSIDAISSLPAVRNITSQWKHSGDAISKTIEDLTNQGLVSVDTDKVQITNAGRATVIEYHSIRASERNQAYGHFRLALRQAYPTVEEVQLDTCEVLAEKVLVENFSHRGLVIANKIFSGRSARPDELSDIFGYLSNKAVEIDDLELRSAFVEATHQFIIEPNPAQKNYLASISQGYFLYHLLGLDPKCEETRRDIFRKTLWLCDSSVLLPLVAAGCHNHEYAVDLFNTLAQEDAVLCTTPNLLQEVRDHFDWALRFVKRNRTDSIDFLRAALVNGSYKQNLFLDGYIRLCADGDVGTFDDYIGLFFPTGDIGRTAFENSIRTRGVRVVRISDLTGFDQEDWGEIEHLKAEIQNARQESNTYRSTLQVESEAEVLTLLQYLRSGKYSIDGLDNTDQYYFISQSQILERVSQQRTVTTWSPEAVYRYLSVLPAKTIRSDLLQQCMLHEYYYAGVSFIDRERYEHFFGPSINAARISFQKERNNYIADLEETFAKSIDEIFEQTTDLEKPFFVTQMGWQKARQSEQREALAVQRAVDAEQKVRKLELEREKAWKTREKRVEDQEAARQRNLMDPKHVRKRKRQARKRKRKKR